jgi:putative methyltransferase (TIGR04325 family)
MNKLKFLLRELIPPLLWKTLKGRGNCFYSGDYSSWEDAKLATTGYSSDSILAKVKEASLQVKQGKALYERDSVLFDQIQHSFPLLAALLRTACENQGKLNVLDFGGSLGSSYYQCKDFLSVLNDLKWNVVEQESFVACGKQYFEDENLKFFSNIEDCFKLEKPDILLLSSVIQYLEEPYELLEKVTGYKFKHIIFDRTAFIQEGSDRLTIQEVPPEIYTASYPAWFFDKDKFLSYFQEQYELIFEFDALAGMIKLKKPYAIAHDKGFFFQRKDSNDAPH